MIKIHLISSREDILTLCPVQAIVEFCKLRGTHTAPFFATGPQAQSQWVSLTRRSQLSSGFADLKLRSAHLAASNPMLLNFACIVPDTLSTNWYTISVGRPHCYRGLLNTVIRYKQTIVIGSMKRVRYETASSLILACIYSDLLLLSSSVYGVKWFSS